MQRLAGGRLGQRRRGPLEISEWLFVNTELTIHLHRPPEGEWIGRRRADDDRALGLGTGGLLFDEHGRIGRSAQA